MKIALQNPRFLFADQMRNFDGYNFEFLRQYRPAIYLTGWKARATRGLRYQQRPTELEAIAARGSALVRERYTQAAVAERLHQEIERRWTR